MSPMSQTETGTDAAVKASAARRTRKVGTVVSAKMEKTVVVEVTRLVKHGRYGRFIKRSQRFLADDRTFGCRPGDVVKIEETRPLSARKRWRVTAIVTAAPRPEGPGASGASTAA